MPVFLFSILPGLTAILVSMWPLLKRDGLGLQYLALIALWNRLIGHNPLRSWPNSFFRLITLVWIK